MLVVRRNGAFRTSRRTTILPLWVSALAILACSSPSKDKPEPPAARVILFGADGADPQIIRYLSQQNAIPTLTKLMREGVSGPLQTDVGLSPVSWTSIATGKRASKHGIAETPAPFAQRAASIKEPRLWDILNANGIKTQVINWFFMDAPSGYVSSKGDLTGDISPLVDALGKTKAQFLAAIDFDIDFEQHFAAWELDHIVDKKYAPLLLDTLPNAETVFARYRTLDNRLNGILNALRPEDHLMFVSDHGITPSNYVEKILWPGLLLLQLMAIPYHEIVFTPLPNAEVYTAPGIVLSHPCTVTFTRTTTPYFEPLTLNFTPSLILQQQISRLSFAISPSTQPITDGAWKDIERLFLGIKQEGVPLLQIANRTSLQRSFRLTPDWETRVRQATRSINGDYLQVAARNGNHNSNTPGFFGFIGPRFAKNTVVEAVNVYDIALTLLLLFDIPLPIDMDGVVIPELFAAPTAPRWVNHQLAHRGPPQSASPPAPHLLLGNGNLPGKDLERLRSLGYLR